MDCSTPGSSVHGILHARILEWGAMPSSRGSSWPRDQTCIFLCLLHWRAYSLPLAPPGKSAVSWSLLKFRFFDWSCSLINSSFAALLPCPVLLSFAESMLFTNRGVWQPCMEQGDRCRFSKSIHSPGFSVSHSGNSQCFKPSTKKHGSSLKAQIMVCSFKQWNIFNSGMYIFFRHCHCTLNRLYCKHNFNMHWETKNFVWLAL